MQMLKAGKGNCRRCVLHGIEANAHQIVWLPREVQSCTKQLATHGIGGNIEGMTGQSGLSGASWTTSCIWWDKFQLTSHLPFPLPPQVKMCLRCQRAFGTEFKSRPANKVCPEESGLKDKWSIAEEQGSAGTVVGPSTATARKLSVSWVDTWKVLGDAQVLALSPVGRMSFLPHQPGPPVCLTLAFAYCQLREDPWWWTWPLPWSPDHMGTVSSFTLKYTSLPDTCLGSLFLLSPAPHPSVFLSF